MPPEPIPAEIPDILHTERLTLRAPDVSDASAVYEAVRESLPELRPWMPWAGPGYTLESAEENLLEAVALFMTRKDLRYHFLTRTRERLWARAVSTASTGRCLSSKSATGAAVPRRVRVFVTETVRALSELAFAQLNAARVEIRCDDRNVQSYRVRSAAALNSRAS